MGLFLLGAAVSTVAICYAQSGWLGTRIGSGGKDLNTVYFLDSKRGWVGGDDGFFSHTEDGGASWVQRRIGTDQAINDIYFTNKEVGFVLAGGSIFGTEDGGHSWREAHRFTRNEFEGAIPELYSLRFNGKKRGWVVGSASRDDEVINSIFAFTKDGGANWNLLQAPTRRELIHIDFVDDKRGWIAGDGGTIMHSSDAGETWTTQKSGTTKTLYHIDFRNEREGWAVGERGTILRTIDGGQAWVPVDSPVHSTLLSVQFVTDDDGWIVGRDGVILRSGDSGRTWLQQESTTKANLYAQFMGKKNGWAVGADGLILRYER
jgi:photosystem II stability/assembly factor-like uncharacterized protein